jgi:hypothetical protein
MKNIFKKIVKFLDVGDSLKQGYTCKCEKSIPEGWVVSKESKVLWDAVMNNKRYKK